MLPIHSTPLLVFFAYTLFVLVLQSLTGESRPVKKTAGDDVQGGTVNSGHTQIMVQATRSSDDSAVSRLIRLVEEAQANRSETEKIVDAFAKIYTPIIVLAALCMCTIPWAWGREVGREWAEMGLVLVRFCLLRFVGYRAFSHRVSLTLCTHC